MVKRISCRVVSSTSFCKTDIGLLSVIQLNGRQREIRDIGIATIKPGTIINLERNPDIFGDVLETLDFPKGQILDFYA